MATIAVIHHEGKPETVSGILDTELTREDLIRIIHNMHEKMQRMQEDYDSLMEITKLLERQNQRLLKEKFERMKTELPRRSFFLIKSR